MYGNFLISDSIIKERCFMFEIGSYVVYRAEGVCIVSDIREESFGAIGGKEKYYILTPMADKKSTVFVPVNNETLCAMMRKLLSAEEICELCASLRNERMEWIAESRARNTRFKEIMATGDRRELIILLNTVHEQISRTVASGKRPTGTDENALRRAKQMLYDEFSFTLELRSEDDVVSLVLGELSIGNLV